MLHCGLLGQSLGHSYSPAIHALLGDYEYRLYEREPEELENFLLHGAWDGLNVTIPYKKAVFPYCDALTEAARRIGSVNTLVRQPDGTILGDNTDAYGFAALLSSVDVSAAGKKALVLGSGGASATVCDVLQSRGAAVTVISRRGENNYQNLDRRRDAAILVNATPVGMFPDNGSSPLDLDVFPHLEAVFDLIYNPARTALLMQAEARGIPCAGGLRMLVYQALGSSSRFQSTNLPPVPGDKVYITLNRQMENLALIGMPGCGKSTVAELLGKVLNRPVYDTDSIIEQEQGMSIPELFAARGEEFFRKLETEVLSRLGKLSGAVISTGGGCVTRKENYPLLHQNSRIFRLTRDVSLLPRKGRPLSAIGDLQAMLRQRQPLYEQFADCVIDNNKTPEDAVRAILREWK